MQASIRGQCQRSWLYGKDNQLENGFAQIESAAALTLQRVSRTYRLPVFHSKESIELLLYIVLQSVRTIKAADDTDAVVNSIHRFIISRTNESRHIDLARTTIGLNDPIAASLKGAASTPLLLDLFATVLVTKSRRSSFITSDHPVVKHNIYLEVATEVGNRGFSSRGLIIYYPIDSHCAILLYDPMIYILPAARPFASTIVTARDIAQLNLLQTINAGSSLYFGDKRMCDEIRKTASEAATWRGNNVPVQEIRNPSTPNKVLGYLPDSCPNIGLTLSFLSLRPDVRTRSLLNRVNNRFRPHSTD